MRSGIVIVFHSCRQGRGLQNKSLARNNVAILATGITKTIVTPNYFVIFLAGMVHSNPSWTYPSGWPPPNPFSRTDFGPDFDLIWTGFGPEIPKTRSKSGLGEGGSEGVRPRGIGPTGTAL